MVYPLMVYPLMVYPLMVYPLMVYPLMVYPLMVYPLKPPPKSLTPLCNFTFKVIFSLESIHSMPYSNPVRRLERERQRCQEAFVNKTFYCKLCDTAFKTISSFKRHEKASSCLSIVTSPTLETEIRPDTLQVPIESTGGQDAVRESFCHPDCGTSVQDRLGLEFDRDACVIVPSTAPLTSMTVSALERRTVSVETDAGLVIEGTTKLTKCVDTEELDWFMDAELMRMIDELPLRKKKPALVPPPSYKRPSSHVPPPPVKKYSPTLPGNVYRVYK